MTQVDGIYVNKENGNILFKIVDGKENEFLIYKNYKRVVLPNLLYKENYDIVENGIEDFIEHHNKCIKDAIKLFDKDPATSKDIKEKHDIRDAIVEYKSNK